MVPVADDVHATLFALQAAFILAAAYDHAALIVLVFAEAALTGDLGDEAALGGGVDGNQRLERQRLEEFRGDPTLRDVVLLQQPEVEGGSPHLVEPVASLQDLRDEERLRLLHEGLHFSHLKLCGDVVRAGRRQGADAVLRVQELHERLLIENVQVGERLHHGGSQALLPLALGLHLCVLIVADAQRIVRGSGRLLDRLTKVRGHVGGLRVLVNIHRLDALGLGGDGGGLGGGILCGRLRSELVAGVPSSAPGLMLPESNAPHGKYVVQVVVIIIVGVGGKLGGGLPGGKLRKVCTPGRGVRDAVSVRWVRVMGLGAFGGGLLGERLKSGLGAVLGGLSDGRLRGGMGGVVSGERVGGKLGGGLVRGDGRAEKVAEGLDDQTVNHRVVDVVLRGVRYRRRLGVVREVSGGVEERGLRHGRVLGVESVDACVCFLVRCVVKKKGFFLKKKRKRDEFLLDFCQIRFFELLTSLMDN